jgi:hypothetical protein
VELQAALAERIVERRVGPGDIAVEGHRDVELEHWHRAYDGEAARK